MPGMRGQTPGGSDPSSDLGYRGRFAPSPTGPLHFGSLVAALGSFLEARSRGGTWLVRVEDIDPPREVPGASAAILRSLERLGFEWDESVLYQSTRLEAYAAALEDLKSAGAVYRCGCTRRQIHAASGGTDIYPGTCRYLPPDCNRRAAVRVQTTDEPVGFNDRLQGRFSQMLPRDVGDFVVRRRDGLIAYQLAVVVDDATQHITDIVRGADLLDNTPRQIHLQRLLRLPTPEYVHLPVVLTPAGDKLSKQTGAAAIDARPPGQALHAALSFLGQQPPAALAGAAPWEIWSWALRHWRLGAVPGVAVVSR